VRKAGFESPWQNAAVTTGRKSETRRGARTLRLVIWLVALVFMGAVAYMASLALEPRAPGMPITGGPASPVEEREKAEGTDQP
jgi:hypothetical protein